MTDADVGLRKQKQEKKAKMMDQMRLLDGIRFRTSSLSDVKQYIRQLIFGVLDILSVCKLEHLVNVKER